MIGKVIVMEPEQFKIWLNGGDPNKIDIVKTGAHIFQMRNGSACHSLGGTTDGKPGPALKGLFGRGVALVDGSSVTADDNYLKESITDPAAKVVKGFSPIMPTFKGVLTEEEINSLVAYIKSLKE